VFTALIAGIDSAIGASVAQQLSLQGWKIYGTSRRPLNKDSTNIFSCDFAQKESIDSCLDQLIGEDITFDLIIHSAAQPSHDWAAKDPQTDFSVNANGTLNLLELTKNYRPKATFIFTSTNKVYGDNPNKLPLIELNTRYEIKPDNQYWNGIDEEMSIDHTTHSLFGVSKTSADLLTQEYSRYFGLKTAVFRGGCLTGPMHSSAELHGFLAYLVKCIVNETPYTIFGYKGKQVRDNIHSKDLIQMFIEFHSNPKNSAVYNAGGGRNNSVSILEAIEKISIIAKKSPIIKVNEENRIGDHQWYVTNNGKFQKDYPNWKISYSLENLIEEMVFVAQKSKAK
jgi:CDP-paratose 2-epimerase